MKTVLDDTPIDELDSQPADPHRQKELLGRLTPPPPPLLTEIMDEKIHQVYSNDTERVPPAGITTPRAPKSPWALDNDRVKKEQQQAEPAIPTRRKPANAVDIRKEVEAKMKASTRRTGAQGANKDPTNLSPYELL